MKTKHRGFASPSPPTSTAASSDSALSPSIVATSTGRGSVAAVLAFSGRCHFQLCPLLRRSTATQQCRLRMLRHCAQCTALIVIGPTAIIEIIRWRFQQQGGFCVEVVAQALRSASEKTADTWSGHRSSIEMLRRSCAVCPISIM
jgi:hypothetical protein